MDLPELNHELSILDQLNMEQYTMGNGNGGAELYRASNSNGPFNASNIIEQDEQLASVWLNTPMDGYHNYNVATTLEQSDMFSDTESLTSCGTAVPSPAPTLDNTAEHFSFMEDKELKQLSVKELNSKLKGLPKDVVTAAKKRRRTLKNRGYAHLCRIKRLQEKSSLQKSKAELEAMITNLQQQLTAATNERDNYRKQYETLASFVIRMQQNRNV